MDSTVPTTISRSARKTISVEIKKNGLYVRAPLNMSDTEIQRFLESKKTWIHKHLQKAYERNAATRDMSQFTHDELVQLADRALEDIPKRVKHFAKIKHVEAGDFVISMRSFQGGLEYSEISGCISSAYVMLKPSSDRVYSRYYRWLLKSSLYINAIRSTSNLVRDGQAMRYANFIQIWLPCPPMDEQKTIADYLDEKCPQIDRLITIKQAKIEKLEQYKKSLIYEYVTGKKEVS